MALIFRTGRYCLPEAATNVQAMEVSWLKGSRNTGWTCHQRSVFTAFVHKYRVLFYKQPDSSREDLAVMQYQRKLQHFLMTAALRYLAIFDLFVFC